MVDPFLSFTRDEAALLLKAITLYPSGLKIVEINHGNEPAYGAMKGKLARARRQLASPKVSVTVLSQKINGDDA